MFRIAALFGLIGLVVATGIIVWSGYADVLAALSVAGWGILWTSLFHLVPMTCCIIGWRALMPGRARPSHLFMLYILWLRSSVNNMMPVARIGGEIVGARAMIKHHIRKTTAIASTVVETTTSILAVFVFDLIGIAMFASMAGRSSTVAQLALGLLLALPELSGLVFIQRVGFFGLLDRLFTLMLRDTWKKFAGDTAKFDRAVHAMYRRTGRVLYCFFWQFMSWATGAGEIWLALYFLGHPISFAEAFMLEALIQASSSVAFAVPGALGVQEAGFVFFGGMLGLGPDIAAATAVIRRCRDLLLYVPGLVVWQVQEGRWMLRKHKTVKPHAS
ncbi:MAG: flippase-like domain-containing protein [Bdellovibrionales bacterium]